MIVKGFRTPTETGAGAADEPTTPVGAWFETAAV
jgi:hypothetical protein